MHTTPILEYKNLTNIAKPFSQLPLEAIMSFFFKEAFYSYVKTFYNGTFTFYKTFMHSHTIFILCTDINSIGHTKELFQISSSVSSTVCSSNRFC